MGKITARDVRIFYGPYNLSGHSNNMAINMTAETPEVTNFTSVNKEYLPDGIKDVDLSVDGFYDAAASSIDAILNEYLAA